MRFALSCLPKRLPLALALAATAALVAALSASANVPILIIATDPFTNATSQHATIVEPDTYSFGSTIIATAQMGRFTDGGASDIGVSVSTNNGLSWTAQALPGTTVYSGPPGPYARISDPSVAYDAAHNVWMVSGLALNSSLTGVAVTLSRSTNGGVSFGQAFAFTSITAANAPGNIRSGPLPSAEISGDGKIFLVWEDCRFRSGCTQNDLVYVTSTNGTSWSAVQRIPIDTMPSSADYFIPGIAVDRSTSGATIHVAVGYYYYPDVNCTFATCQLDVGYISSTNGGTSWSAATQLRGPMAMSWLPDTTQGRMVGDYMSTSFDANGLAHPVFAEAYVPTAGGTDCATATPNCNQPLETPTSGLAAAAGAVVANDPVVYTGPGRPTPAAFRI